MVEWRMLYGVRGAHDHAGADAERAVVVDVEPRERQPGIHL